MSEIEQPTTIPNMNSKRRTWVQERRQVQIDRKVAEQSDQSAEETTISSSPTGTQRRASVQDISTTVTFLTPPLCQRSGQLRAAHLLPSALPSIHLLLDVPVPRPSKSAQSSLSQTLSKSPHRQQPKTHSTSLRPVQAIPQKPRSTLRPAQASIKSLPPLPTTTSTSHHPPRLTPPQSSSSNKTHHLSSTSACSTTNCSSNWVA
jgi:hypothetical protein